MRRVLILIGTVFSLTTFGQSAGDHLEPTGGYFNMYRHEYEYYPFIYKHLIKDISWNPIARVLTLPSFSPENVLSIESIDREEKIFKVIYKVCKESIWYREGDKNDIEVIKYEVGIDTTTVNLIRRVFTKAISETRYYEDPGMGLDGVTYIFSAFELGAGIRAGEVWSPDEGTKMNDLVEFVDLLISLAKSDKEDDRLKLRKQIKDKGDKLLKRLSVE